MTLSESLRAGYSTRMEIPLPVQIEYKRALSAMKTCSRKQSAPAFTLVPALRGRFRAFTLVEMLVVLGMIVILLSAMIPAVTSLSKANGRKAALANLLGGIEQARAEAINTSQATYVSSRLSASEPHSRRWIAITISRTQFLKITRRIPEA